MSKYQLDKAVFHRLRGSESDASLSDAERRAVDDADFRALYLLGLHPVLLNAYARSRGLRRDDYRKQLEGLASTEEVTPPELFLSAVAACGVELVHVIARDEGRKVGRVELSVQGTVDRGNQKRTDVTVFNSVRLEFSISGTDGATAAQLVEGFKRR